LELLWILELGIWSFESALATGAAQDNSHFLRNTYAWLGKNLNEALTLAINFIILSQTEKACSSTRKLLFFSNA
jgi:hypothetical protein